MNKKRERTLSLSKKLDITLGQKEIFLHCENINFRITISSILENGKNKIFISCNHLKSPFKYEIELSLDILKEKSKTFRICKNLEEAYKILKNVLLTKKIRIKENEDDSITIILSMDNCIEFKEEIIFFDLKRKDNYREINSKISNNIKTTGNNSISKSIVKSAKKKEKDKEKDKVKEKENICDFGQKLNLLFKSDESKDLRIRKLIITGGELLFDCHRLKKELKELKKYFQNNKNNLKEIENKENEEKENNLYENKEEKNIEELEKKNDKKESEVKTKTKKALFQCNNINTAPKISFFKIITNKANCKYTSSDNNFITFESIEREKYLVYGTKNFSIHFYDFNIESDAKRIKKAHDCEITNFRHVYDSNYNRDLLLSISDPIKNIKVWG